MTWQVRYLLLVARPPGKSGIALPFKSAESPIQGTVPQARRKLRNF